MSKKKKKKHFVWNSLRVSFWAFIVLWVLAIILNLSFESERELIFAFLLIALTIFVFIISIIHLTRYKEKTFAVVSLVISSIVLFFILIGATEGTYTNQVLFNEENQFVERGYYDSLSFQVYDYSYLNLVFDSDKSSNIYLLTDNEYVRYENGEDLYYIEANENGRHLTLENRYLSPGSYYIVIESLDEPITYDIFVETTSY